MVDRRLLRATPRAETIERPSGANSLASTAIMPSMDGAPFPAAMPASDHWNQRRHQGRFDPVSSVSMRRRSASRTNRIHSFSIKFLLRPVDTLK
jgi:hypothetical protein